MTNAHRSQARAWGSRRCRQARLHDARHTAATILLVLNVATRAVMGVMGWSHQAMVARYQHIPDELRAAIAKQLGGLLWSDHDERFATGWSIGPVLLPD